MHLAGYLLHHLPALPASFVLSKIVGLFALPSNIIVTLGIAGLVLGRTRFARAGHRLAAAALILIAIIGFSPFGNLLIEPLEDRFPPWDAARGPPAGIVVLGGAVDPGFVAARGAPDINEAAERLAVVPALARRYPLARIIYSGGDASLLFHGDTEAHQAAALIESFGVAKSRLTLEQRSRNTAENAIYSKELAAPKQGERWLLVTSAYHMPRAIGAFRKAGFDVDAYPVDYRTVGAEDLLLPFVDAASGLRRTDIAAHEWVGLMVYWITGRSSEFFPRP
jgi:uncharacterized SAM-binding protein YcdF (DUF218 family)